MRTIFKLILTPTLILFAAMTVARAESTNILTVAVYDFTATSEMDLGQRVTNWNASLWNARRETTRDLGPNVTVLVTANLAMETNLIMVERAELDKALNEQAFGISGMVSSDAAAKIGQITGAKVLVAGRVIKTGQDHLIIVANIIGTETGRLFATKVEGAADSLSDLTSVLSRKIAQTIIDQTTNLVIPAEESHAERLARIVNSITGTNRPTVSISIIHYNGKPWHEPVVEGELGVVLLKAGFTVVDDNSSLKPDVEITGGGNVTAHTRQGGMFSSSYTLDVKILERRSGSIIAFDRQDGSATDAGGAAAATAAQIKAVDALAERILPMLAK
jgi:hypothetical protein